jgi:hypothetical protein
MTGGEYGWTDAYTVLVIVAMNFINLPHPFMRWLRYTQPAQFVHLLVIFGSGYHT